MTSDMIGVGKDDDGYEGTASSFYRAKRPVC